jgi:hypothetical protein
LSTLHTKETDDGWLRQARDRQQQEKTATEKEEGDVFRTDARGRLDVLPDLMETFKREQVLCRWVQPLALNQNLLNIRQPPIFQLRSSLPLDLLMGFPLRNTRNIATLSDVSSSSPHARPCT